MKAQDILRELNEIDRTWRSSNCKLNADDIMNRVNSLIADIENTMEDENLSPDKVGNLRKR